MLAKIKISIFNFNFCNFYSEYLHMGEGGGVGEREKMDCLSNILATDSDYLAHPLSLRPQTPCMDVEEYLHSLKALDTPCKTTDWFESGRRPINIVHKSR